MSICQGNEVLLEVSLSESAPAKKYAVYEEDTGAQDNFFSMEMAKGSSKKVRECIPADRCFVLELEATAEEIEDIKVAGQSVVPGPTVTYQLEGDDDVSSVTTTYLSTGTTDVCFPSCPATSSPLMLSSFNGKFQGVVWKIADGNDAVLASTSGLSYRSKGSRAFWQTQVCIPQNTNSCHQLILNDANGYSVRPESTVAIEYQGQSIQMDEGQKYLSLDLNDSCEFSCGSNECPVEFFWRRSVRVSYMYPDISWVLSSEGSGGSVAVDSGSISNTATDLINYHRSCQAKDACLTFTASVPAEDFVPTPIGTEVVYHEVSSFQLLYDNAVRLEDDCNFGGVAPKQGRRDTRAYQDIMTVSDCPRERSLSALGISGMVIGALTVFVMVGFVVNRRSRRRHAEGKSVLVGDFESAVSPDAEVTGLPPPGELPDPIQTTSAEDSGTDLS